MCSQRRNAGVLDHSRKEMAQFRSPQGQRTKAKIMEWQYRSYRIAWKRMSLSTAITARDARHLNTDKKLIRLRIMLYRISNYNING